MHLEDGGAPGHVGGLDADLPVEAAGAQQGGVQDVGAVGGGDENDVGGGVEAVHLDQQLVEGLLALVVPAAGARAAVAADGVDLVDEDDGGGVLLGLVEQVAHARGAHATNISTNSEAAMEKKGTPASPATALARRVLPVPGGP